MYVLKEHLMIRDKKHIDELISACLAGQLDRASQQELDAWADAAPENGRYFEHRQQEWFAAISEQQKAVFDKDRAFTRFLEKTEDSCERIHPATNPPRQFRLSRIWKYAAAVAIAVIIAVFSYRRGEQKVVSHYTDIVIDVPKEGAEASKDGFVIRRNAVETGVNVLTAVDTARALATSLENKSSELHLIDIAALDEEKN